MQFSIWSELYDRLCRANAGSSLFDRLVQDEGQYVLVAGCQRSGTSWMRKVLGEALPNALAPGEHAVAGFLIDGIELPVKYHSTVVLQTTFANIYPDSYQRLPDSVPVIFMARNPFSVCWSMVYNWDSLAVELAHRRGCPANRIELADDRERWEAAIELYVQSSRTGIRIITDRPVQTRLVMYDRFVKNPGVGLRRLANLIKKPVQYNGVKTRADTTTMLKQDSLPSVFRQMVEDRCLEGYERLLEQSRSVGNCIG